MSDTILTLDIVVAVWAVLFAIAMRDEIAACWRCRRARSIRRRTRHTSARVPQQRKVS